MSDRPYTNYMRNEIVRKARVLMQTLVSRDHPLPWTRKAQIGWLERIARMQATVVELRGKLSSSGKALKQSNLAGKHRDAWLRESWDKIEELKAEVARLNAIIPDIWAENAKVCTVPDCCEPQVWLPSQDPDRPDNTATVGLCERHRLCYTGVDPFAHDHPDADGSLRKHLDRPPSHRVPTTGPGRCLRGYDDSEDEGDCDE